MFTSLEILTIHNKENQKNPTTLVLCGGESGMLTVFSFNMKNIAKSSFMTLLEDNKNAVIAIQ
jgi:hypothetical protein